MITNATIHQLITAYLVFNGFVLAAILYTQLASHAARDWPSTTGRVTSSRTVNNYSMKGLPRVTYTYEVDGVTHTSFRVSPGGSVTGGSYTRDILARYPAGAAVTVYYDPTQPGKAYLEKTSLAQKTLWQWFWLGNLAMPFLVYLCSALINK